MRVAVIEDDTDVREVVAIMVRDETTKVVAVAATSHAAFILDWDNLDGAIIDRRLLDGLSDTLVRWVRTHYPQVTVVLLTADELDLLPHDLRELYVQKPVGAADLRSRLHAD